MDKRELGGRYALFIAGLFLSALGIALAKMRGLGVSPISSIANVVSARYTALSLGTCVTLWNCVLIAGEILLLRRRFQLIQLLQIPVSFSSLDGSRTSV